MKKYMRYFFVLFFSFFFGSSLYGQGSIDDIRNRLNMNRGAKSNKLKKDPIDINSFKPNKIKGWYTKTAKGKEYLKGMELRFKVKERADQYIIPVCFCYFYDKDLNLLDKKKISFVHLGGVGRPEQHEGDLMVPVKRSISVFFSYPASFQFKYALAVIGDSEKVFLAHYPKRGAKKDFDFDEKQLVQ